MRKGPKGQQRQIKEKVEKAFKSMKKVSDQIMQHVMNCARDEMAREQRKRALKELIDSCNEISEYLDVCSIALEKHKRASVVRLHLPRNIRSLHTMMENLKLDIFFGGIPSAVH